MFAQLFIVALGLLPLIAATIALVLEYLYGDPSKKK